MARAALLPTLPLLFLLLAVTVAPVDGHGHATLPPSRNGGNLRDAADCGRGQCMYFSQPATIPGEPTINAEPLRTFNVEVDDSGPHDYTRRNPWRAPGSAPVLGSGCGRAGGGPVRSMNGGTAKEFGLVQNQDGADLPKLPERPTQWRRGSTQEVAWANNANHGGGYSWRLCKPTAAASSGGVSEECFQRGHLAFDPANKTSVLQWTQTTMGNNRTITSRIAIPRVTVSEGTFPAGSEWARVPIPACRFTGADKNWPAAFCPRSDCAGCCNTVPAPAHPRINASWWRSQDCIAGCAGNGLPGSCPLGKTQFPEPLPGMSSLWSSWLSCSVVALDDDANKTRSQQLLGDSPHDMPCSNAAMIKTNIVDRVVVPADIPAGDYLLSWRWDAEQTNQVRVWGRERVLK